MPPSHSLAQQLRRVWPLSGRWLPQGWFDALRQLLLFAGAYYVYRIVRGIVDGHAVDAYANARDIVSAERGMGLFFEPGLAVHDAADDPVQVVRPREERELADCVEPAVREPAPA